MSGNTIRPTDIIAHTDMINGAVSPGNLFRRENNRAIHDDNAAPATSIAADTTENREYIPTAIPTSVPLNPYRPRYILAGISGRDSRYITDNITCESHDRLRPRMQRYCGKHETTGTGVLLKHTLSYVTEHYAASQHTTSI